MAKKQHLLEIWDMNHMFESSLLIFFIIGALATVAVYYADFQEHGMITPAVVQSGVNDSLDGCDLFSGNWVYDNVSYPLYKELDCPFITGEFACAQHGRMDSMYRHWRWQPHDCNLPRFDAKKILERLRDKKILFVGDSLNRNQFVSMVCMLQTVIPNEQKSLLKVPNQLLLVTFQEYNVSIDFYWAPLLVESNADNPRKHKTNERIIRIDSIGKHAEHWVDADVLVFNSYNWWRWPTLNISNGSFEDSKQFKLVDNHYGYNVALEQWSTWFYSHVNHTRTKSYFMTMTAVHKRGEEWGREVGTNCFNETEPILNDGFWESGCDLEMMGILESSLNKLKAKGVNVQVMNISQLTQYRRDGHTSIYRKHYTPLTATQLSDPISYADCSHWCVPGVPDTWNELLLAQILRGHL